MLFWARAGTPKPLSDFVRLQISSLEKRSRKCSLLEQFGAEQRGGRPSNQQERKRKSQREAASLQQKHICEKERILSAAGTQYFTERCSQDCTLEVFAPQKEAILHFTLNHLTFISVKSIKSAASPNETRSSLVLYLYSQTKSLNLFLSVSDLYFVQSFFHFHIQDHDRALRNSLSH